VMWWPALLMLAACPQDARNPECVTVPKHEAAAALQCVAADLPECLQGRHLDDQLCEVDKHELAGQRDAARERVDKLQHLLDTIPTPPPPVVAWYEKPEFVVPTTVAVTLVTLHLLGQLSP
jgi:hypothetical protein